MGNQTAKSSPPRSPPILQPGASPVFKAEFSDGVKTKMTIYTPIKPLDLKRAVVVSHAAYSARKRIPMSAITATITEASFSKDGKVLAEYTAADLAKVAP
jgi:hypothetical protein